MAASSLGRVDAGHSADTVEWNRWDPRLLVCGTYQLDPDAGVRHGRLLLFQRSPADPFKAAPGQMSSTAVRAGVLDCTWISASQLASADADGHVSVHSYSSSSLTEVARRQLVEEGLVLSIDCPLTSAGGSTVVTSDSKGHLSLLDLSGPDVSLQRRWEAHDFEAWCAALCPGPQPQLVASGGDDCRLRLWDVRTPNSVPAGAARLDMGVTCVAWHPTLSHLLAAGCYDEHVRLWDQRALRRPVAEVTVGGGVWRLRWCPESGRRLLGAAMHAGFVVVAVEGDGREMAVAGRYEEHDSLAYGADWCPHPDRPGEYLCATCSFYDRALHFWSLSVPRRDP